MLVTLHCNLQWVLSKTLRNGDIFSVDFMKCDAILWHSLYFRCILSEFREQLSRVWLYSLCLLCADMIDGYSFVETWTFWHTHVFSIARLCKARFNYAPHWFAMYPIGVDVDAIGESNCMWGCYWSWPCFIGKCKLMLSIFIVFMGLKVLN